MPAKVTFIGAGSIVFARNLIGDILSFPELEDSVITLMDINPDRLEQTKLIAEQLVDQAGAAATIEATTDRRAALEEADYVLNMIHVGGREPFENEIRIPEQYGVGQAVGDTLGPGGVFRFLRTAPIVLDIAQDMEELCPNALLMNYTNPMAMLCWAIDESTDINVVGLCHSVQHTAEAIASYTNTPKGELEYWVAGINHVAWFLKCTHNGKNLYPALYDSMEDEERYDQDNVRFDLLKHFAAFVTESSNHMSEYVPYFRTTEQTIQRYVTDDDFEFYFTDWMKTGGYLEYWIEYQEDTKSDYSEEELEVARSKEYASRLIHSVETGEPRRMNLNVRNERGPITNLGTDACVEVPCLVDGHGIHPCTVGDLPNQLAAINRSNVAVQRLAVRGLLENNFAFIRQAIKLDPLTASALTLPEIDQMTDDLLAANDEYLPEELLS